MKVKLALLLVVIIGLLFLPTTVFLLFGMMPTIAAFVSDRSVGRNKTICIGAMNFAGCFPFLLEFWTEFGQQTVENAFRLVADLETIIVIYMLAAGGYAIDKAVTGITASVIIQKSQKRLKTIEKEQAKLVKRWGEKVTGQHQLDDYGFPVKPIYNPKADAEKKNSEKADGTEDGKKKSKKNDTEKSKKPSESSE